MLVSTKLGLMGLQAIIIAQQMLPVYGRCTHRWCQEWSITTLHQFVQLVTSTVSVAISHSLTVVPVRSTP